MDGQRGIEDGTGVERIGEGEPETEGKSVG